MQCAYCQQPLACDACQAPFMPSDPATYQALSQAEEAILCLSCGELLTCHWCKTPYDGRPDKDTADAPSS